MMKEENSYGFALAFTGGAVAQKQQTNAILACNEKTAIHGLALTAQQAAALVSTRADSLKKTGRVEFGSGVIDKLILAFYDSPYISQANYEDTLYELIAQGRMCALLSDRDVERIQEESLALLAEQTEKWNRGKSSSIRVEGAQELLSSILYTVGVFLKTCPSPEDAVAALKQESLRELFQNGLKKIERKVQISRLIHRQISKRLFQTKNVFYRSTVRDGIDGFFKLYRPEFSAQEIHITADYPAFFDVKDLAGIEFIIFPPENPRVFRPWDEWRLSNIFY